MNTEDFERFAPEVRSTLWKFKYCLEKAGRKVEFGDQLRRCGPYMLLIDGTSVGLFVPRVGRLDIDFGEGFVHVPVRRSGAGNAEAFEHAMQRPSQRRLEKAMARERELARRARLDAEDASFMKPLNGFQGRAELSVHRRSFRVDPELEACAVIRLQSTRPELILELLELAERKGILAYTR